MSFEAALKSHLQADATISGLVADRIYPGIRQERAPTPAVTYQVIAFDQVSNLSGRDGSLRNVRVQVDCWSLAHSACLELEAAVRARMDTAASTFRATLTSALDDFEPETRLYRRSLDFSVWFTET